MFYAISLSVVVFVRSRKHKRVTSKLYLTGEIKPQPEPLRAEGRPPRTFTGWPAARHDGK